MNRLTLILGIVAMTALASAHQIPTYHPDLPRPRKIVSDNSPEVLKGIKGVRILVESPAAEEKKLGLTKVGMQQKVEQLFKRKGIRILTEQQQFSMLGASCLYIGVTVYKSAYIIVVRLDEPVRPEHDPQMRIIRAIVWDREGMGFHHKDPDAVHEHIQRYTEQFCTDYLKANPKSDNQLASYQK